MIISRGYCWSRGLYCFLPCSQRAVHPSWVFNRGNVWCILYRNTVARKAAKKFAKCNSFFWNYSLCCTSFNHANVYVFAQFGNCKFSQCPFFSCDRVPSITHDVNWQSIIKWKNKTAKSMSFLYPTPTWSCSDTRTPHRRVKSRQSVHNWSKAKYPWDFKASVCYYVLWSWVCSSSKRVLRTVSVEVISIIVGKAELFAISFFLLSRSVKLTLLLDHENEKPSEPCRIAISSLSLRCFSEL